MINKLFFIKANNLEQKSYTATKNTKLFYLHISFTVSFAILMIIFIFVKIIYLPIILSFITMTFYFLIFNFYDYKHLKNVLKITNNMVQKSSQDKNMDLQKANFRRNIKNNLIKVSPKTYKEIKIDSSVDDSEIIKNLENATTDIKANISKTLVFAKLLAEQYHINLSDTNLVEELLIFSNKIEYLSNMLPLKDIVFVDPRQNVFNLIVYLYINKNWDTHKDDINLIIDSIYKYFNISANNKRRFLTAKTSIDQNFYTMYENILYINITKEDALFINNILQPLYDKLGQNPKIHYSIFDNIKAVVYLFEQWKKVMRYFNLSEDLNDLISNISLIQEQISEFIDFNVSITTINNLEKDPMKIKKVFQVIFDKFNGTQNRYQEKIQLVNDAFNNRQKEILELQSLKNLFNNQDISYILTGMKEIIDTILKTFKKKPIYEECINLTLKKIISDYYNNQVAPNNEAVDKIMLYIKHKNIQELNQDLEAIITFYNENIKDFPLSANVLKSIYNLSTSFDPFTTTFMQIMGINDLEQFKQELFDLQNLYPNSFSQNYNIILGKYQKEEFKNLINLIKILVIFNIPLSKEIILNNIKEKIGVKQYTQQLNLFITKFGFDLTRIINIRNLLNINTIDYNFLNSDDVKKIRLEYSQISVTDGVENIISLPSKKLIKTWLENGEINYLSYIQDIKNTIGDFDPVTFENILEKLNLVGGNGDIIINLKSAIQELNINNNLIDTINRSEKININIISKIQKFLNKENFTEILDIVEKINRERIKLQENVDLYEELKTDYNGFIKFLIELQSLLKYIKYDNSNNQKIIDILNGLLNKKYQEDFVIIKILNNIQLNMSTEEIKQYLNANINNIIEKISSLYDVLTTRGIDVNNMQNFITRVNLLKNLKKDSLNYNYNTLLQNINIIINLRSNNNIIKNLNNYLQKINNRKNNNIIILKLLNQIIPNLHEQKQVNSEQELIDLFKANIMIYDNSIEFYTWLSETFGDNPIDIAINYYNEINKILNKGAVNKIFEIRNIMKALQQNSVTLTNINSVTEDIQNNFSNLYSISKNSIFKTASLQEVLELNKRLLKINDYNLYFDNIHLTYTNFINSLSNIKNSFVVFDDISNTSEQKIQLKILECFDQLINQFKNNNLINIEFLKDLYNLLSDLETLYINTQLEKMKTKPWDSLLNIYLHCLNIMKN